MPAHRDPTFDSVAAKESVEQRQLLRAQARAERDQAWRNSDEYREVRQRRIRAALRKALRK